MDLSISLIIAAATSLVYIGLLYAVIRYQSSAERRIVNWAAALLVVGLLTSALGLVSNDQYLLNQELLSQPALMVYGGSLFLVIYGVLTASYLQQPRFSNVLLIAGVVWLVALFVTSMDDLPFERADWFANVADDGYTAGYIALGGWLGFATVLLIASFLQFYNARLPELANRALYWVVISPLAVLGAVLVASSVEALQSMGWIIQIVGVSGAVYGIIALRVLDVRATLRTVTVNMALTLVTTAAVLGALLIAEDLNAPDEVERNVLLAGLALATATLHAPIYLAAEYIAMRLLRQRTSGSLAVEVSRFSEAITGIVELTEVVDLIAETLRDSVQVRRSELLLCTPDATDSNLIHIEPRHASLNDSTPALVIGSLQRNGVLFQKLQQSRRPILQYAIDYDQEFKAIDGNERDFFRKMRMAAYAPISVQDELIGIIAVGPKYSDAPFSEADMSVLSSLANQTGIALRNARLVDDLRKREQELEKSNEELEDAKSRLEATDAVKTDFITIASHELRTPLAQIRGHSDILSALGNQGSLSPDHLNNLTENVRKATDRLETLIGDMLDVSRLDMSALDLRFTQTSMETVVRLAIEPLQDSIRERKQSLTAKGLRQLPQIEADTKRMVQAVRNLVLNAVKFTPDGGRIEIYGELLNNAETGVDEVKLSVKDSGIGIDKKNQEAIFEKFFRVGDPGLHSTGTTKFMGAGPGLGLTIARGVVEGHGGRIWVESTHFDAEALPGSVFYLVVPVKPPSGSRRVMQIGGPSPRATGESAPQNGGGAEPLTTAKHQIVAEPDPTILNPSASRAGLAAAALAAAEQRKKEGEQPTTPPSSSALPGSFLTTSSDDES